VIVNEETLAHFGVLRLNKRSHLYITVEGNEPGTHKYTYRMDQTEWGDFELHYLINKNSCNRELTVNKQDLSRHEGIPRIYSVL